MFQRFSNSWQLVKSSAGVLRSDTELILFPILSGVGVIFVTLAFVLPIILSGGGQRLTDNPLSALIGFAFYLCTYFIIFFCNSALVGAAMIRLKGGDPTVKDGFRIAFSHIGAIFGYALLAATVGLVLKAVQERAGFLGRIVVAALGFAWSVATFLAVPVLVIEGVGPIEAVKRSGALLKQTWGEQVIGNGGIGLVFGWMLFLLMLVGIPTSIFVGSLGNPALLIATIAGFSFAFIALLILNATLSSIYTAAVYLYAAENKIGGGFENGIISNAFRAR